MLCLMYTLNELEWITYENVSVLLEVEPHQAEEAMKQYQMQYKSIMIFRLQVTLLLLSEGTWFS